MPNIYILDFDGVISNSLEECFLTAYWAFKGKSRFDKNDLNINDQGFKRQFLRYRYLVGPAGQYYFLMKAIEGHRQDQRVDILTEFESNKKVHKKEAGVFAESFFKARRALQKRYPEEWLGLNPIFPGMKQIVSSIPTSRLYIASTKDEESMRFILDRNEIPVLPTHIYGKNFSSDKKDQIQDILQRTEGASDRVFFFDDNIEHVRRVKDLGVECYLVTWGYNTPELRRRAVKRGYNVIDMDEMKRIVGTK